MLSGEVKIREQVVVAWEATLEGPCEGWEGRHNYRVEVTGRHQGRNFKRSFLTPHDRNEGPMALAGNIMTDVRLMLAGD